MDPLLPSRVDGYLDDVAAAQHHDAVLVEMERRASEERFPIVGRAAGRFLELVTGLAGARRVVELGSGYGYSAYWFARAVGEHGQVVCTEVDPDRAALGESYLRRAGLWERVDYHVGDGLGTFGTLEGAFDVVFCDLPKDRYPAAWAAAEAHLAPGGLFIADNALWYGRVAGLAPAEQDPEVARSQAEVAHDVVAMTRAIIDHPDFVTTIAPINDGVLVAHRTE